MPINDRFDHVVGSVERRVHSFGLQVDHAAQEILDRVGEPLPCGDSLTFRVNYCEFLLERGVAERLGSELLEVGCTVRRVERILYVIEQLLKLLGQRMGCVVQRVVDQRVRRFMQKRPHIHASVGVKENNFTPVGCCDVRPRSIG